MVLRDSDSRFVELWEDDKPYESDNANSNVPTAVFLGKLREVCRHSMAVREEGSSLAEMKLQAETRRDSVLYVFMPAPVENQCGRVLGQIGLRPAQDKCGTHVPLYSYQENCCLTSNQGCVSNDSLIARSHSNNYPNRWRGVL